MGIFVSYFNNTQLILLVGAGLSLFISILFYSKHKEFLSVGFLLLAALCVFTFAATLDPFLNLWDERFHALVAKNMMNHPLMPTLYDDPAVIMDYDRWDRFHIWLHKQPLFLWQIALSFKLFGVSELTLRLPSVFLGVVLVLISYRIGRILINKRVGLISGILIITTLYLLELIAGRQELEHNDVSFVTYVSLSIWAYVEYFFSKKKIWLILIGIFSGAAILCKWLVGLTVYFGWIILRLLQRKYRFRENIDLLISLLFTISIALPWQIISFIWFPAEAKRAFEFNSVHFINALEGHGGTFWYHFDNFNNIYGHLASFLIIPAFYLLLKTTSHKKLTYSLLSIVLVVFLFFSIAATKMPSFTIAVFMLIIIAFSTLFDRILFYINGLIRSRKYKNLIFIIAVVLIIYLRFDIELLQEKHTTWKESNSYTEMLSHNKEIFNSLDLPENAVLFNVKGRHYVEAMFYSDLPAYNFLPTLEQYKDLIEKGRIIAVFIPSDGNLPYYLRNDSTVVVINKNLKGYN